MARYRPNEPPARAGLSASCVVLPPKEWPSVLAFLVQRFSGIGEDTWRQRFEDGLVVDDARNTLNAHTPYRPGMRVYYYRAVPSEAAIPFQANVTLRNDYLLVVDKPHFLPVLPSGKYVQETLLVRLKNILGLKHLTPIHRIDRDTAGLVMFSVDPGTRDAYHALFRQRAVHKTYWAVAPLNSKLTWPQIRNTRIAESAQFMQQIEVEGEPNTETRIDLLEEAQGLGLYELKPITGHRHQLRVHMNALGLPLVNDGIYPVLTPEGSSNFEKPLQLLARQLEFTDPVTGESHSFTSQFQLNWPPSNPQR